MKKTFLLGLMVLLYIACSEKRYENALYKGVLPCADCEGISYSLTLNDSIYKQEMQYVGKSVKIFKDSGSFKIENGEILTLLSGDKEHNQFKILDDKLVMLDSEGNEIVSGFANNYLLIKSINH